MCVSIYIYIYIFEQGFIVLLLTIESSANCHYTRKMMLHQLLCVLAYCQNFELLCGDSKLSYAGLAHGIL